MHIVNLHLLGEIKNLKNILILFVTNSTQQCGYRQLLLTICGFWPWGPGTAGSVLATLIWAALAYGLGITGESLQSITFFLVIVSTILGTWATAQLQPYWGEDPSRVVIDEMAGVWIPLSLLTPLTAQGEVKDAWWWALVALVLFRFFDMVKPLGIKKLDNRQGAFYVMADDLLGGFYAAVSLIIIKIILVSAGII